MGWKPPGERRNNVLKFAPRRTAPQRKLLRQWLVIVPLLVVILGFSYAPMFMPKPAFDGFIERVVDGDSLHLHGQPVQIRLWGLDAPEWDTPAGPAATAALTRLALGKHPVCDDMGRDRYQRILGRCYLPDGRALTAAMIETGTAQEFWRYTWGYFWLVEKFPVARFAVNNIA